MQRAGSINPELARCFVCASTPTIIHYRASTPLGLSLVTAWAWLVIIVCHDSSLGFGSLGIASQYDKHLLGENASQTSVQVP